MTGILGKVEEFYRHREDWPQYVVCTRSSQYQLGNEILSWNLSEPTQHMFSGVATPLMKMEQFKFTHSPCSKQSHSAQNKVIMLKTVDPAAICITPYYAYDAL